MPSFEHKIASTILAMIRSRRIADPISGSDTGTAALAPAKVREAQFSDFGAVAELKQRWGLAADSLENWVRLWRHNPALAHIKIERPIGWVLEAEGRVVGYLGNISQLYRYGDKTLTSVTSHGFVVDPSYRGIGMSLIAAYFRQRSVDLYISTGAIAPVGKIGRIFKSEFLSHTDYEDVLFWVLQPYPFSQAIMRKLGLKPVLSWIGGILGSMVVTGDKLFRRRWPRNSVSDLRVTETSVSEIGNDFEGLWIEKVNEKPRLLAERGPATLRWHFEVPGDKGNARVFCCSRNGELVGYAVVRDDSADVTGLRKSIIADMLAKKDDATVMQALLVAVYKHAQQAGSHVLEILGFPPSIRHVWSKCHPYIRKYPTPLFSFKAADPTLHRAISEGMTWYASPLDGDLTLIRPSYPSFSSLPVSELQNLRAGNTFLLDPSN